MNEGRFVVILFLIFIVTGESEINVGNVLRVKV